MRQSGCILTLVIVLCLIQTPVFGNDRSGGEEKVSTSAEVRTSNQEALQATGRYLQQRKELYQKKTEEKLKQFEDKIKRLYVRAGKNTARVQEKISHASEDLIRKSESVKSRLRDLKDAGEGQWEQVRDELDTMLKNLEHSYNRAAAMFKD